MKTTFIIGTIIGILWIGWSIQNDKKLESMYEGVEPCSIRNDVPACL